MKDLVSDIFLQIYNFILKQLTRDSSASGLRMTKIFMFNKLKQYKDLRDQAKTLQNMMAQQSITVEKNGVKLTINGNFEITTLNINNELSKEKLEQVLVECFNDATKKIQRVLAEKMQGMGGMPQF